MSEMPEVLKRAQASIERYKKIKHLLRKMPCGCEYLGTKRETVCPEHFKAEILYD